MKQTEFFAKAAAHNVTNKAFPKPTLKISQWKELDYWRGRVFGASSSPRPLRLELDKMKADGKLSLGILRPVAWFVELVRGCNLRCGFCATRLFPKGEFHYMKEETWKDFLKISGSLTPFCRIEFCNAGEPTLHPALPEFIRMAREKIPYAQLLLYTNGTTLLDGRTTYSVLFEAGLNIVFVDMYSSLKDHLKVAEKSGYPILEKDKKTGVEGFFKFWFGEYMQDCRKKLYNKNRIGHEKYSKCSFAANRCDIARWGPELLDCWWGGEKWIELEESF